ncbi:YbcC family protein [Undibacterium sp. Dicai25W]|uniref:YbcC family protein n=1 Tax=Undibacterium sp. Dicai25W TaxID=3413034 RepID=UPI003BF3FAC5
MMSAVPSPLPVAPVAPAAPIIPNASRRQASVEDQQVTLAKAMQVACNRVAPTWPLDRLIAVNPWWGFVDQSVQKVSDMMSHLCGTRLTMPTEWYLAEFKSKRISEAALAKAVKQHGLTLDIASFIQACSASSSESARFMLLTDALDAQRDLAHQPACRDVVTHAIGQHCASWFDEGQARWKLTHATSLYVAWREIASYDNGPSLFTGIDGIADRIAALPDTHEKLIEVVCEKLKIKPEEYETYFTALLLSINGWAAWCAYLNWQAGLQGKTDNHLQQLLAIRLAWEWVLADSGQHEDVVDAWHAQRGLPVNESGNSYDWVWQDALELTWQAQVNQGLALQVKSTPESTKSVRPAMQAVFCIDVRSERMRRALEASDPSIRTHGFAGFFGLPIEYLPFAGHEARPQLPGLLAPKMRVVSVSSDREKTQNLFAQRRLRLGVAQAWGRFRTTASSGFGFVETTGLSYAWKLVKSSLHSTKEKAADTAALSASERDRLVPVLENIGVDESIDLVAGILRAMSMTSDFAPVILLVGHGSQTANNPHAAGLDCGACCGQTGEVNARVLAHLLNRVDIRYGLRVKGIDVPEDTLFVAGLHNTTTDEIRLFDVQDDVKKIAALEQVRAWLAQAGQRIREERAPTMGMPASKPEALMESMRERAGDWSQVRPEWGLANNAAFIAAPRQRTQHMNLHGRSFLHDYNHAEDAGNAVLEQILTAPVLVAHWINMQYFASTVDNRRWGSGNKVLHNVVGGHIGVFEGNGGDLRIGLPLQSLHDGEDWVHTPLRLSVWMEAPRDIISGIVHKHEKLWQLVDGGWLHLFSIDPESGEVYRYVKSAENGGAAYQWVLESAQV